MHSFSRRKQVRQRGFTYLWLLFAIALAGAALAAIGERVSVAVQREKEAELMFRGQAIERAIASYWAATPAAVGALPHSLNDLVEDRRGVATVRHLRRVYPDPFTGLADWALITTQDGAGIRGVHSRSPSVAFDIVGLGKAAPGARRRVSERLFVFAARAALPASSPSESAPSGRPAS